MSTSVDQDFIKNFEAEVYIQYQQMGSKLRNTVRVKDAVIGATTTFMNVDHQPVECVLHDYYAGAWVGLLDDLKTNINEQQVVARAGAYALGWKTNELIVKQLASVTATVGGTTDGLTKDKVLAAFETLGDADVPDDGQRFAIVGWKQWRDLLNVEEFANADYVGDDDLPWKAILGKRWLGTLWLPHSGLPWSGGIRRCFWYHKTAVGHAGGADVKTDITWHGDRAAPFVNNMMSQGACLIDGSGVVAFSCNEN